MFLNHFNYFKVNVTFSMHVGQLRNAYGDNIRIGSDTKDELVLVHGPC